MESGRELISVGWWVFCRAGDLMAALLLAWLHHHPRDLKLAVEKATTGLQAVLCDTALACGKEVLKAPRTAEVGNRQQPAGSGYRKQPSRLVLDAAATLYVGGRGRGPCTLKAIG
jgi:hypothetical protein